MKRHQWEPAPVAGGRPDDDALPSTGIDEAVESGTGPCLRCVPAAGAIESCSHPVVDSARSAPVTKDPTSAT